MNLQEQYKRLFKARVGATDKKILREYEEYRPGKVMPSYKDDEWLKAAKWVAEYGVHSFGENDYREELRYDFRPETKLVKKHADPEVISLWTDLIKSSSKGPKAQLAAAQALLDILK